LLEQEIIENKLISFLRMEGLMIKVGEGEAGMTKSHRNNNINDKEINQNNNRIDLINELDYLFEHISQQLQEK
jgi:hypothetical protein